MKPKILFLVLLFSFICAQEKLQIVAEQVRIYHSRRDSTIAAMALRTLEEKQEKLQETYGLEKAHIEVYIAADPAEYSRLAGSASPFWSMGLASGNRMLIKSPSFSRQSLQEFQKTLLHECVHLALSEYPLPLWFNEGFAQYEAGTFSMEQKILLARTVLANAFLTFRQIEELQEMSASRAELAYAQSVSAVDFLISNYGRELLEKCLLFSKKYNDFPTAFRNAYLMTPEHFEKRWQDHAKKRYRFYLALDLRGTFWLFLSGLLILGYILTKLRRRRILKKWEQEEAGSILNSDKGDTGAESTERK
ncbi:MAG: hypothetical protein PHT46_00480 [Candidatus Marinimicrobia bacterium]|nr:hypothetical protein [Candidatus Neomarinimicrobiota bacterium]